MNRGFVAHGERDVIVLKNGTPQIRTCPTLRRLRHDVRARITRHFRTPDPLVSWKGPFRSFVDRPGCRFFRARTKTRLALRMCAVCRTTSLIVRTEEEHRILEPPAQASHQWSSRSRKPCESVPKQNGQPASCVAAAQRPNSFSRMPARSRQSHSSMRSLVKIKFKLLKTGPWLLPVGSRCFTHFWRVQ